MSVCPHCRRPLDKLNAQAQQRIEDLEHQVRLLSSKAAEAADRAADLEDELYRMANGQQAAINGRRRQSSAGGSGGLGRSLPFLGKKSSAEPANTDANEIDAELSRMKQQVQEEKRQRREAEAKVLRVNAELEELSQTLFEEANTMVASERKLRARAEEKLKIYQQRDEERNKRMLELEAAVDQFVNVGKLVTAK